MNIIDLIKLSFFILVYNSAALAAPNKGCTQEQAVNKMMAIGRVQTRLMSQQDNISRNQAVEIAMETAPVGKILADKNYKEACERYDKIALKHNIDLAKESKGLVTLSEAAKDGGKRGGKCSQSDASIRMTNYHTQIHEKINKGEMERAASKQFAKDTASLNELLYTNPSEVCVKLDLIKEQYQLK